MLSCSFRSPQEFLSHFLSYDLDVLSSFVKHSLKEAIFLTSVETPDIYESHNAGRGFHSRSDHDS